MLEQTVLSQLRWPHVCVHGTHYSAGAVHTCMNALDQGVRLVGWAGLKLVFSNQAHHQFKFGQRQQAGDQHATWAASKQSKQTRCTELNRSCTALYCNRSTVQPTVRQARLKRACNGHMHARSSCCSVVSGRATLMQAGQGWQKGFGLGGGGALMQAGPCRMHAPLGVPRAACGGARCHPQRPTQAEARAHAHVACAWHVRVHAVDRPTWKVAAGCEC